MTVTAAWNGLTLAGKIVLPLILLIFVLITSLLLAWLWLSGLLPWLIGAILDTLGANIGIVRFVLAATAILLITVPTAFIIIFLEMKMIAFVNLRIGPNRTGPWGTLASVFHGFKVLAKEDFTPTGADVPVFTLAPVVAYLGARADPPGHALRARPLRASTWTSACSTSSPSAASAWSG